MQTNIRAGDVPILIRKTAEEIAGAFYDMNRSDRFRAQAGTQRRFVRNHWTSHVAVAIECLSALLSEPGRSEIEKAEIYDALVSYNERGQAGTPKLSTRILQ